MSGHAADRDPVLPDRWILVSASSHWRAVDRDGDEICTARRFESIRPDIDAILKDRAAGAVARFVAGSRPDED